MHLVVVGTGYAGLVSGACLADFGHRVTCIDADTAKIDALSASRLPVYEPGLDRAVSENRRAGRLSFSTDLPTAVGQADVVFISVGTPPMADGDVDLGFVFAAARSIARAIDGYTVVVTKSTVPPGTGDAIEALIRQEGGRHDFAVVANPEFLREGVAIEDFKHPDRIVIGAEDARSRAVVAEVYRPLYTREPPFMFTGRRTAELIKYAANAFLATKISFINELADLCERVGADVQDVARGMGLDNRIRGPFLHAGPGFGGSGLPTDVRGLSLLAERAGVPQRIAAATGAVNGARKSAMAERVIAALGGSAQGKTVAILGLTFKPDTDDMRELPAIDIVAALAAAGGRLQAFDPKGMDNARPLMPGVAFASDPYECATGADVLVIVTEWDSFRALDLDRLKDVLRRPVLVDLRNVYRPQEMSARGFAYYSIGRAPAGV